ncbi:MAG: esterase-like activity of phytase family protein [Rhodococcus sp. (in: high G+C Gram-positive bacteria)]
MRRTLLPVLSAVLVVGACSTAEGSAPQSETGSNVSSLTYVDSITVPDATSPFGVPFGGISGIDRSEETGRYLATSDDRSEKGPARFYELELVLDDAGHFTSTTPNVTAMTVYKDPQGIPFAPKGVDPESIRRVPGSADVLVSSEGDASNMLSPFVARFAPDGSHIRDYPLPVAYVPDASVLRGVRNNLALEGLTVTADGSTITALTENALVQDGDAATTDAVSRSRAVVFDSASAGVEAEFVYEVDPIGGPYPDVVDPATAYTLKADRGASELLAIDDTDYLVVERGLIPGSGNTVQVYRASTVGATNVAGKESLDGSEAPMTKALLFDFAVTGENPDNVEGISWGPTLADGTRTVMLCADDNFNAAGGQHTMFHVLVVE